LNFKQNSIEVGFWKDRRDRSRPGQPDVNQSRGSENLKKMAFPVSVGFTRPKNRSTMVFQARAIDAERFGHGDPIGSIMLCVR
jgi:hypothetical protein